MGLCNKFITTYLCMVVAALVISQAAEIPKPSENDAAASASPTEAAKNDQLNSPSNDNEDDEEISLDDQGENEDDDDEYYDSEIPDSPEEDLAELSEEHFEVKQDCAELQEMIEESKKNGTAPDPELQKSLDDCKQDLADITKEMRELAAKITSE